MELSAIGEQVFAVESIRKKRVRKVGSGGAERGERTGTPPPLPPRTGRGEAWWARARPPGPCRCPAVPSPHTRGGTPAPARGWRAGDTRVAREVVRGGGEAVAAGVQPVCRMSATDTKRVRVWESSRDSVSPAEEALPSPHSVARINL